MKEIIDKENILMVCCKYFQMDQKKLFSKSRLRFISIPRQVTYYLLRKHTHLTLSQIGKVGRSYKRKHETVLHSIRRVDDYLDAKDREVTKFVNDIELMLFPFIEESEIKDHKTTTIIEDITEKLTKAYREIEVLRAVNDDNFHYTEEDKKILKMLNGMNIVDKKEALFIMETKKKVRDNMTHQKLRAS